MSSLPLVSDIVQWFFENLGLDFTELQVTQDPVEEHIYTIGLKSTDSSLMIGLHGKTLEDMQYLLSQMCEQALETRCLIHIEVNDYMAEKQRKLFAIVDRKIDLARHNGIDQVIYDLSWFERKMVHAYVSEKCSDIETKSVDSDKWRELHVKLKEGAQIIPQKPYQPPISKKSTSDIAWDLAALDMESVNI